MASIVNLPHLNLCSYCRKLDLDAVKVKTGFFEEIQTIANPFDKIAMLVDRDIFRQVQP